MMKWLVTLAAIAFAFGSAGALWAACWWVLLQGRDASEWFAWTAIYSLLLVVGFGMACGIAWAEVENHNIELIEEEAK